MSNVQADWVALGQEALDIEVEGLLAVKANLGPSFNQSVELLAACAGRVIVSGIGKSGLVGRKLAATFSSTGTASFFMHPVEGQHGDLGSIRAEDVLIAISNSGITDELNSIIVPLKSIGVRVIALTGGVHSPLAQLADLVINTGVPREACPLNLAPTSSTTAVLAVGDALAVCLIQRKEFTVQDFKRVHPGGALGQHLQRTVQELMHTHNLPLAKASEPLQRVLPIMDKAKLGIILLEDEHNNLTGVLTDGDLRRALCNISFSPQAKVETIMTSQFAHANLTDSAAKVLNIMENKGITVLPVLDEAKKLAGLIHMHDLLGKGQIKFT